MSDRDNTDLWTALTIGAVVGIGAVLLVRARQSDRDVSVLKRLAPARKRGQRAVRAARRAVESGAERAGDAGSDLLHAGRDALSELRHGARDIVLSAREELEKAARDSLSDARKAARKAARRTFR